MAETYIVLLKFLVTLKIYPLEVICSYPWATHMYKIV